MERGEGLRQRLKILTAHFPPWLHVVETVQRDLETLPHESSDFAEVSVTAELPEVLVSDWAKVADQLGWSLGRMLGYLALQGAIKVSSEADQTTKN